MLAVCLQCSIYNWASCNWLARWNRCLANFIYLTRIVIGCFNSYTAFLGEWKSAGKQKKRISHTRVDLSISSIFNYFPQKTPGNYWLHFSRFSCLIYFWTHTPLHTIFVISPYLFSPFHQVHESVFAFSRILFVGIFRTFT